MEAAVNRSFILGAALGSATTAAAVFGLSRDSHVVLAAERAPPSATAALRSYDNTLTPIKDPKPLLADYPRYVEPVVESRRFEAARLVDDEDADLEVRAWRWSYNARGIIEIPNRLRSKETAVIMVHPWA